MLDMEKKYWLIKTGLLTLILPAIIMGFNYFMDPLWCFDISHQYNQFQVQINERRQKTNYITYHDFNYRGLLIGSSRTTFISQYAFKGLPVYNYSVSSLRVDELSILTDYAKKRNGRDFDYIFLGLDFENARLHKPEEIRYGSVSEIIEDTNSLLYRLKTLISIDTAKHSWQNLQNYRRGTPRYYDRNNVVHIGKLTRETLLSIYSLCMKEYTDKTKPPYHHFIYHERYKKYLERFKKENRRSKIIVILTPASVPVMELIVAYGLLDNYFRWISEVIDVFGEAYLFMYPNSVTSDYLNSFFDPSHMKPHVGDMIVDFIYNKNSRADSDFGMLITRANIKEKRPLLERLMKNARDRELKSYISREPALLRVHRKPSFQPVKSGS
ncbi:MAG TPA: hypothetical protein PKX40_01490 [Spirochaetota bacterium]|nr:hypothetical protein [Spirochaetota bacterium]